MALGALLSTTGVAAAADSSLGAANFYTSDKVTVQKVTFKNQYKMNVAGNLFIPKGLKQNTKNPAIIVGHPMGAILCCQNLLRAVIYQNSYECVNYKITEK